MEKLAALFKGIVSTKAFWWIAIFLSSALFTLCDSMAKVWIEGGRWSRYALLLLFLVSPFAYMLFGVVTQRGGLAIASGLVNSFLVLGTMFVGLVIMKEWNKVSTLQYVGMALAVGGIALMLFFPKEMPQQ